jgi:carboxypeptidase PM20D1
MPATARRCAVLAVTPLVLFAAVTAVRTARYDSMQAPVAPAAGAAIAEGAAERLAGAIRIRTISPDDPAAFDGESFRTLHAYLAATFPLVHQQLGRETVNTHSLLYTWPGSDPSLPALMLVGHMDVVPVDRADGDQWQQAPFGGRIVDGFIWGRGAIDNKSTVVGALEAIEMLLRERFRPVRTVYLAFGHDEEVGGTAGARQIAALLESRGVVLETVVDEGGVIGDGVLPGISTPVALVGVAEKGFLTIELATRVGGGHSSLPPRQSAIGIVGAAVARLEARQMPARLEGPTRQLFERLGPRFSSARRAMFANLWLTAPLVLRHLERSPTTNAMVRTTTAPTVFQAGTKDNVLANQARAVINFRILPGDSVATVLDHVRQVVADERVEVAVAGRFSAEPSTVSSTDSESFRQLERTIRSVVPEAVVAPYLVVVATDARHYAGLSRNVFRFLPLRLTSRDLGRIHGIDERIGAGEYDAAIRFYRQLVITAAG